MGGLGDALRRELAGRAVTVFGVEGWPACGTPPEALRAHGLDGASLARRISSLLAGAGVMAKRVWLVLPDPFSTRRLRRLRDRRGARASGSAAPGGRARAPGGRGPELGAELGTVPWTARRGTLSRRRRLRRARPATDRPRARSERRLLPAFGSATVFATASTASGCGRATRITSWTRRSPGRLPESERLDALVRRWLFSRRRYVPTTLCRADARRVLGARGRERAEPAGACRSSSPLGDSGSRPSGTSRAGITRSARASSRRTSTATSSRTT